MDVVKDTENEKFSYKMVTEACFCVILNLYVSFFFQHFQDQYKAKASLKRGKNCIVVNEHTVTPGGKCCGGMILCIGDAYQLGQTLQFTAFSYKNFLIKWI